MAGSRTAVVFLLLLVPALFLVFLSGNRVEATDWVMTWKVTLTDNTPGATPDHDIAHTIPITDSNFSKVNFTFASSEMSLATDAQIPDATYVGKIAAQVVLSIFNGPCSTPLLVNIPFMECTTDPLDQMRWIGSGDNMVQDNDNDMNEDGTPAPNHDGNCTNGQDDGDGDTLVDNNDPQCINEPKDNNGIPSYCDHYPDFLAVYFDPDGAGPLPTLTPRARYTGHTVVLTDSPATELNMIIFHPEQLRDMPGPEGQMSDTQGYIGFTILTNPVNPATPSTITDFCTPLVNDIDLYGLSKGEYLVKPGPPMYETDTQCNGSDDDGDTYIDDGCMYLAEPCELDDYDEDGTANPGNGNCMDGTDNDADTLIDRADPECAAIMVDDDGDTLKDEGCGYTRMSNPAAGTGIYGSGTHILRNYGMGYRDVENDNIANNLDTCPYATNTGVDGDADGLDSACDPNDASSSPGAPNPNGVDDDGDTAVDEDPVDNADNDGDTLVDEDGECPATGGMPDEDQDCYPNRQDVCPLTPDNQDDNDTAPGSYPADSGPPDDGIGDACDASASTSDGHFHVDMPPTYVCIAVGNGPDDSDSNNDPDNDDDGVCDATEDSLGSDKDDQTSTPEYIGIDLVLPPQGSTFPTNDTPGTCSDLDRYDDDSGNDVPQDNDGDGDANADDTGCDPIGGDADDDGVADGSDNCSSEKNPEQVNRDADADGDECDTDDDADGFSDYAEGYMGTDPKDRCGDDSLDAAWPLDFDNDQDADIVDVLKFKPVILKPMQAGGRRFDFDADGDIDIVDVLKFKPYILTSCTGLAGDT